MSAQLTGAARTFLEQAGWGAADVAPLAGDASFRHYFRLFGAHGPAVLMVAPPDKEAVEPFLAVGRYLADLGLSVPAVLAADVRAGFALLEDLGEQMFVRAIADGADERRLYEAATDVLAHVHGAACPAVLPGHTRPHALPLFTTARLQDEVNRVLEWHWEILFGRGAGDAERESYAAAWAPAWDALGAQPQTLVQFDYHSPNLLWLPEREGLRRVGVLDYQDAVLGPGAYDVVSLIQDPRRDLPAGLEPLLVDRYLVGRPDVDAEAFLSAYAILGAQRAARVLGTFARLWKRDGKPGYLKHQGRVWRHLDANLDHPALAGVRDWFDRMIPADLRAPFWAQLP